MHIITVSALVEVKEVIAVSSSAIFKCLAIKLGIRSLSFIQAATCARKRLKAVKVAWSYLCSRNRQGEESQDCGRI